MQATINGIRMNYAVEGPETGPPVVLHHPLATNLSIWDELTAALTPALSRGALRCARPRPDRGAEGRPTSSRRWRPTSIGLMDHLKIERAHFLGLSMGGMVGQYLGLCTPSASTA